MNANRRRFLAASAATLAIGALLASARPHLVQRWALYLGSPQTPGAAHLFLDPYPSAYACQIRVKVFATNGELAFCRARFVFESGTTNDAILAAEFDPFSPTAWFCLPRPAQRIIPASR